MNLTRMIQDLEEIVGCESFSADHEAVARSARVVADQGRRMLGARAETIVVDGVTHLRWTFGIPRVLLVGHHDTVWPVGTLRERPWSLVDGIARGPGVFDMKAGLVQMFHAMAALPSLDGVCVLVTGDEEVGSLSSRALVEDSARGCAAAFVLEASADGGALKTARKGTSMYEVTVHGRAAHAGLEPERGANAGIELAHQVLAVAGIADLVNAAPVHDGGVGDGPARGVTNDGLPAVTAVEASSPAAPAPDAAPPPSPGSATVTPTVLSAGTTTNTVPALARLAVDVRVPTRAAQRRVDELMRALSPRLSGTRLEVRGGPNRPPLEHSSSAELFALAQRVAAGLGLAPLSGAGVGGASDGNYTAGVGCPTLDGLGAVGGGAHADGEHVVVAEMPGRTALLAGLVEAVLG
ncbi:glutamate carboxypeptidase [Streptosporangium becharense]|uniref:Glutamate carboxypeptidase n=1 Tax=Streptosporangium becharense TaxID=1816182 RepID=A0A7W9MK90_9ACTN|nr:M20 family metallopeptidase [Streptosporangium becharense]MBB2914636.1 glutamate carboxypeptidase [Streptosporangium becharense]MBB5823481.1 glutamate carboxypeptidase [Streptosporangium becharense]